MIAFPPIAATCAPFQTHPSNAPVATARPALFTEVRNLELGTL